MYLSLAIKMIIIMVIKMYFLVVWQKKHFFEKICSFPKSHEPCHQARIFHEIVTLLSFSFMIHVRIVFIQGFS